MFTSFEFFSCIIWQALRSGNKECPNCRCHLSSLRSLRPDPLFDDIIKTVFPNRAELDRQQSKLLEHLAKTSNRKAMLSSIEEGKRHQAQSKGRGPRKIRSGPREDDDSSVAAASLSTTASETGSGRGPEESFDAASELTENNGISGDLAVVGLEIVPYKEQMKGPNAGMAKKWKRRYIKVKDCATGACLPWKIAGC